jgi:hypothetical protein
VAIGAHGRATALHFAWGAVGRQATAKSAAGGSPARAESACATTLHAGSACSETAGPESTGAAALRATTAKSAATLHPATTAESSSSTAGATAATAAMASALRHRLRMQEYEREDDHCRCQIIESHDKLLLIL